METAVGASCGLDEAGWSTIVDSILANKCTPFLGAGVAHPHLPSGDELSRGLAAKFEYPLTDVDNLPRVAQFVATSHRSSFYAKGRILETVVERQRAFDQGDVTRVPENYSKLAALSLPIYLTTNYDDFMVRALRARATGKVQTEVARWNDRLVEELGKYSVKEPTPDSPLVFHLHGMAELPSSILATEDDYIDFMVSLANRGKNDVQVLVHWVRRALSNSLLFIGYSLNDWNFRVLMRHLMKQQKIFRPDEFYSVSIQVPPDSKLLAQDKLEVAKEFLSAYLGTTAINILWCSAGTFLDELERQVAKARRQRVAVG